ncbi:MAG: hypothetical protein HUK17_01645 [Bacteroidales bacterium]|nr:hypothetical protein [Bacteroidales bacterium]
MKKQIAMIFALTLAVVCSTLVSCADKEEPTPFVGTYDITVVTDSVGTNEDMYSNDFMAQIGRGEPVRHGTLTIASEGGEVFEVSAEYVAEGSQNVFAYSTTAVLNEQQQLVLTPCVDLNSVFAASYFFTPIANAAPLVYGQEMGTIIGGINCRYKMTVTATKQ